MSDANIIIYILAMILLWIGGFIAGRAKGRREESARHQQEEFDRFNASLYVPPPPPLTQREQLIAELHDQGMSLEEIGERLRHFDAKELSN